MSFDKKYPNRKDRRKPYYRSGRFDRTCRPGGSCPYCKSNRLHKRNVLDYYTKMEVEEWLKGEYDYE
jgi:hypothetical protein